MSEYELEITRAVDRELWDAFVERHPLGQFQQCTAWAETKAADGWEPSWVITRRGGAIVGGAQALVKTTRAGRVGFVNKGPLAIEGPPEVRDAVARSLVTAQQRERLRALIAQPPDLDRAFSPALQALGFTPDALISITTSTLVIDVSRPLDVVERQMRRDRRMNVRQAGRRGVTIVEGDDADVPEFFRLMLATCEHQHTTPNPATIEAATALWHAFAPPRGRRRLCFAMVDGRAIATSLSLAFGDRVTIWKVGWDRTERTAHANTLLAWDAISWASTGGYRWFDFASLDRDIAEAKARDSLVTEAIAERRDVFKLGFGGQAWLLPPAMTRLASAPLRTLHRWAQAPSLRRVARLVGVPAVAAH
jgi:peptidoglycan pentaglycine glycine transferase (the first glycine)